MLNKVNASFKFRKRTLAKTQILLLLHRNLAKCNGKTFFSK